MGDVFVDHLGVITCEGFGELRLYLVFWVVLVVSCDKDEDFESVGAAVWHFGYLMLVESWDLEVVMRSLLESRFNLLREPSDVEFVGLVLEKVEMRVFEAVSVGVCMSRLLTRERSELLFTWKWKAIQSPRARYY